MLQESAKSSLHVNVFFVDETGFQVSMRSFYGRAKRNQRAVCLTTALSSRNFSIIACMGINSVHYFTVNYGGINDESFTTYITKLVSYIQADSTEPAYVFMDNTPIHKVLAVRSIFEANPSINLIFIPAY